MSLHMGKRTRTLKAGGGQSSAILDHQKVQSLTPLVAKYVDQIYTDLSSQERAASPALAIPLSSKEAFLEYFLSASSTALAPPVNHDLTFPLCNYFISSSHNTYLSGNQLYGSSTTEAYTNVLTRGCRCLEIDVWNGEDDEVSSVSSSDIEHASHDHDHSAKKRAISRLKSIRGKAKDKLRGTSPHPHAHSQQQPVPEHKEATDGELLAKKLSPLEIAESRAILKTEPRVYHGYTLTKDIPFRHVCEAIRDSAFIASTLPVIVSLEVHCNLDQQQVMVQIMEETWKGMLVDMTDKSYDIAHLPSPDALRNKILIKVKWTPHHEENNNPLELAKTNSSIQTDGCTTSRQTDESTTSHNAQQKKASKILEALSRLGVYTRAYSFKSFGQPEASIPTHVFSLDENKLGHIHSHPDHGPSMFSHNRNYLVRIYPSGLRVNSSNIDPAFSWRQGAQMVALNWQSLDKGMMLNEGMFAGEEGYVLKPEGYRSETVEHIPTFRRRLDLTIRLMAGQNLPVPADKDTSYADHLKPYVKFQLHVDTHGPPGQGRGRSDSSTNLASKYKEDGKPVESAGEEKDEDERKLKRKTRTAKTSNPDYARTEVSWKDVSDVVEQLSFLRVKVQDDKTLARDDLLAWACIRLDRLRTGYRFLHLLDIDGEPTESVLLVHIEKAVH